MKFAKRTISVLLAVLMLVSILPLSVSAASLKITTQPKTSYTAYGSTAKATVKATGDGLKYTWYVKNAGASKYTKSSITKSTYSAKMTDSIKGRSVYCVVKDKKGKTVKSSTAILRMKATITTEPKTTYAQQGATAKLTDKSKTVVLRQSATITTQPKTTSVALGETAKLTIKAKGDDLKYAWYIKNAGSSKYSKSSVTKSTYSVTMSEKVDGRYVYCVVTDKYGKTEKSKTVMLKLKDTPLTIVTQPRNIYAKAGDTVSFSVAVSGGTAPYTYQWQYMGHNFSWKDVAGWANGAYATLSFGVGSNEFTNGYQYRCVITDADGNKVITNEVWVVEKKALAIKSEPGNKTAKVGDIAVFGVTVEGGTEPYTYQWQYHYEGGEWFNTDSGYNGGQTKRLSFVVTDSREWDMSYQYRCIITDADGNQVISKVVWVIPG